MSSPLSSDIPKPYGSTEKLTRDVNRAFALPVPAFGDLSKAANDVRKGIDAIGFDGSSR
jgi:hypothetical protein